MSPVPDAAAGDAAPSEYFSPPLADAADFPAPVAPMMPPLAWADLWPDSSGHPLRDVVARALLSRDGRSAIALAAEMLGLGPGKRVLLPAYHCPSLVEPLLHAGVRTDFYPLNPDLSPVADVFRERLAAGADGAVFVHFFGFDTDANGCAAASREAGTPVIQDCAHALYALANVDPGDFAIASVTKFFPVDRAGLLLAPAGHAAWPELEATGAANELRALVGALRYARSWRRLRPLSYLVDIIDFMSDLRRPRTTPSQATGRSASGGLRYFDPRVSHRRPARFDAWLLHGADFARAARRRRANYRQWVQILRGAAGIRPFFGTLPDATVPYVFPALVDDPAAFTAIRSAGVPLYRWEELAPSGCPQAAALRERLLQLPCHQGLDAPAIDALGERVLGAVT